MVSDSACRLPYWILSFPRSLSDIAVRGETKEGRPDEGAISRYGMLGGRKLAIFRLMKCYPFHPGEMDPVKW